MSKSVDMGTLTVPASGVTLIGSSASDAANHSLKIAGQPVQVMRLDLAPGVLTDILKSSLNNKKKIQISFGRVVVSPSIIPILQSIANCPSFKDTSLRQ